MRNARARPLNGGRRRGMERSLALRIPRYLDKLLLLYDSIRHVGPILFFFKSIVSGIRQQVVRISLILRLTSKKFQKFFLSAFCFRPNITRGKIRFPFDRRRNDTNGPAEFADPRATVEGEKVKESEKERKKKEERKGKGTRG